MSGDPSAWRRLSESLVEVATFEVPTEAETPSEPPSATEGDASDGGDDASDGSRVDLDVVPEP